MRKLVDFFVISACLVGVFFLCGCKEPAIHNPSLDFARDKQSTIDYPKPTVRIAIVIDDFGYNVNNLEEVFKLDTSLTLSILPNLIYSEKIAEAAYERGYEVMLHLPLEPHEKNYSSEDGTILTSMDEKTVLDNLNKAINNLPYISGVSNHMGSKATENEKLMTIIFERIKKEDLYFLDSRVTPESVCEEVASKTGLKFAVRSVFLDNESDIDYIKNKIADLEDKAIKTGSAVGIGHDRLSTLLALQEAIPEMKEKGIEFVFLSELTK